MKKTRRSTMCITLAAAMLAGVFASTPIHSSAADGVSYTYRSWNGEKVTDEVRSCSSYSTIGSQNDLTIGNDGWYVVNGDAAISNRVTVTGTANIILLSGTLTCNDGIRLSNGNTLNIYPGNSSEGTLTAKIKGSDYANIGGNENETCGTLNFYGGTLNAENDGIWTYGAAIGGGEKGGAGELSFYGGKVNVKNIGRGAALCTTGAAIGSGGFEKNKAPTGSVNIYDGEITASCYRFSTAAGIGGGEESKCPEINILGGKVTAKATEGAGIGTGQEGSSSTITIRNAAITAEGDLGAAIGSGEESDAGNIIIESSFVTADVRVDGGGKSNEGAGIGGGNSGSSTYIKIDKSVVNAYAAKYGAGIGGGDEGSGGTIEITDSNIFACSGQGGAGIGGGDEKGCNSITIKRSYVVATTDSQVNTAAKRFLQNYGNNFDTIMLYLANNPATTEQMAVYSAGSLLAMLIANLAEGTRTGAGIGSGHGGTANSILIEDSVVAATGGDCAAGIGGGISGGFGTIDIKNSKICAQSVTDGAGIGSGESGSCGTINITDNSDVAANGGSYGAGIGGGDDSSAGTININNSSVKAYGGTDAAGIGGGEGGSGGTINIYNSDVLAAGKEYGAGIGGGEDCGVDLVSITGKNSNVVAIAGDDGNSVAIGNGDYNSFFHSCPHISVSLSSSLKVRAGSSSSSTSVYTENSRFAAVWGNKYAKVFLCEHENTEWRISKMTTSDHTKYCADCGERLSETAPHEWNDNDICTVCGAVKSPMNLTFVEKNENGQEIRSTVTVLGSDYYPLPECENVPNGYGFLSWKVTYDNGTIYIHAPGETLIPQSFNAVIEAIYMPLKETTYIDESGKERTVMAKQISALATTEFLFVATDGWYVVDRNLDQWGKIRVRGDVRFIIEDGCSLSATKFTERNSAEIFWYDPAEYSVFSLYGQKNQTGVLDVGYYNGTARFSTFRQYGAVFKAEAAGFDKSGSIYAGTFDMLSDTYSHDGEIGIYGGNVHLARLGLNKDSEPAMELGWTKQSDRISLVSFADRGPVKIRDGQAFIDDNGTIYRDSITTAQQEALSADIYHEKTLRPYIEHDYADPEWIWDNDYTNATAVFRCRDCDDTQEIKARVTYEDSGKNRTSTASCTFYGNEYTTTQTKQIIFDITAANTAHGTVTANKTTARADDNIKLTLTPDSGYVLNSITVKDADNNEITVTDNKFVMPESNVTVSVEFTLRTANIHVGGVQITGNNCSDILGDGSVSYDFDTNTLTLTDAEIGIANSSNIRSGIRYNERSDDPFNIVLNGRNRIVDKAKEGTEDIFGIALYAAAPGFSVSGYGTLDIELDPYKNGIGIQVRKALTLNDVTVTVSAEGNAGSTGVDLVYSDTILTLKDRARLYIDSGGIALKSNRNVTNLSIEDDCGFEATSDSQAFNGNINLTNEHPAVMVNTDPTLVGSSYWDGSAALTSYKYIRIRGEYSPYHVKIAKTEHGTVKADREYGVENEYITLTSTPDPGYELESVTITDTEGREITGNKETLTFLLMPSDVLVTAVFKKSGEPTAEAKHIKDYSENGYVASLWTITVSPGAYAIESLSAAMNGTVSGDVIKPSPVISGGPAYFAVVVDALKKDIRSISAVINGSETVIGYSDVE